MRARSELPTGQAARRGLRRRVRSERAQCSSEQREDLGVGADVGFEHLAIRETPTPNIVCHRSVDSVSIL